MTTYVITAEMEILFGEYLEQDEKSKNTIEKYRRDLRKFVEYIDGEEVTKELVIGFKEYLVEHYAVNSVNSIIASLNRFMQFAVAGIQSQAAEKTAAGILSGRKGTDKTGVFRIDSDSQTGRERKDWFDYPDYRKYGDPYQ